MGPADNNTCANMIYLFVSQTTCIHFLEWQTTVRAPPAPLLVGRHRSQH